ncbi:hypothetical protein PA25_16000 [Pseudoalteromonas sp. A25]|uniref:glycosyltransferase family protein n=1 Tax=Pseudoalteromonas sp. A25 TaxID=116092 RepID=UPI001260EF19|nr:glycosyltransferase [Pseudoalteromonas sp. A25]BBN81615.1 hypothetical protein PA25_16000 [Pseudoalteromonas sp. A25]
MSDSKKIFILNNLCGQLMALGKALEEMGHQVAVLETDANGCRDLVTAKNAITAFEPDIILQQNFNVYMLSGEFGEALLDWIEAEQIKQLFWFVGRPDCMSKVYLFEQWVEKGYFKKAEFFCTAKAMMPFFEQYGLKADHLPAAIKPSSVNVQTRKNAKFVTSYFSNTVVWPKTTPMGTITAALSNTDTCMRYFLSLVCASLPNHNPQSIVNWILDPVRQFFNSLDIDFITHQLKRDRLDSALQHVPAQVRYAVLHQVEYLYSDFISYTIYQNIKSAVQYTSGSNFWDALQESADKVGSAEVCQLDVASFNSGAVISFSPFLTMSAPSSAPLSIVASGNVAICEFREELTELLPAEYVTTYKTIEELSHHIDSLDKNLSNHSDRIVAAQDYVLTHHTHLHRAQTVTDWLNK